jgi:hypothetical protein
MGILLLGIFGMVCHFSTLGRGAKIVGIDEGTVMD